MNNLKKLTDNNAPMRSVAMGSSTLSLESSLICGEYSSEVRSMSTARSMHATVDGGAPSWAAERRAITWKNKIFYFKSGYVTHYVRSESESEIVVELFLW